MTDFGVRGAVGGSTEAKQDTQITAEEAIQVAAEALTKQKNVTAVNAVLLNDAPTNYTSAEIDCAGYRKFLLRIISAASGTPTSLKINVQFSHGGGTYENYMRGPFGSLMYEGTVASISECVEGECLGAKMKIYIAGVGTEAGKTFTVTCKVILTR